MATVRQTASNVEKMQLKDYLHIRSIASTAASDTARKAKTKYLVFMITGNPGLIEYYRDFLGCLNDNLASTHRSDGTNTSRRDIEFDFYGHSMGGFELGAPKNSVPVDKRDQAQRSGLYDLAEQIVFIEQRLLECVAIATAETGGRKPRVILMGHSVGSYILLELIRRHRARLNGIKINDNGNNVQLENGQCDHKHLTDSSSAEEPDICSGICLFPTVVDIAKSPQGQILSLLSRIPFFPLAVSLLARIIVMLVPSTIVHLLVHKITGMRNHPANVTAAFISSPIGVQQALYMGADEMRTITTDKWDSEIWGASYASTSGAPRPKLFFYFGMRDHWVADRTRDDLLAIRGRSQGDKESWRPWMEVDQLGVPHGFCISKFAALTDRGQVSLMIADHSAEIAQKCATFIKSVVDGNDAV